MRSITAKRWGSPVELQRGYELETFYGNRVVERYGNVPASQPANRKHVGTETFYIEGFTVENGAGAKGSLGKGSAGIAASSGSENNGLGSCEAHDVGIGP